MEGTFYKLTTNYDLSFSMQRFMSKYKLGETTLREPNCGPLTTFDSLENVNKFLRSLWSFHHFKLWKCEIEKSLDTELWIPGSDLFKCLPEGTVCCDKIKIVSFLNSGKCHHKEVVWDMPLIIN